VGLAYDSGARLQNVIGNDGKLRLILWPVSIVVGSQSLNEF
jgi:hypothetical protein